MEAVERYLESVFEDYRNVKAVDKVTRGRLVAAYYFLYNADMSGWKPTFEDVFNEYKDILNPILKEAHYQPISSKNFFDMLLIAASCICVNNGF